MMFAAFVTCLPSVRRFMEEKEMRDKRVLASQENRLILLEAKLKSR